MPLSHTQVAFLAAYEETGNVTAAADAAGIQRGMHYRWLDDAEYEQAFEVADLRWGDILEGHARRLAKEGVEDPVFHQGVQCGTRLRYPIGLIEKLLEAAKPDRYRKNVHIDGNLTHSGLSALTDAELERIARGGGGGAAAAPPGEEQNPDVLPG